MLSPRNKAFVVGISGRSGSGKTYLLRLLQESFPSNTISVISQDDYYLPITEQQADDQGQINFDLPSSIDQALLATDLRQLATGNSIKKNTYTFNNPSANSQVLSIQPAPIIIIEGLFIYHFQAIAQQLDLKLFIDCEADIALSRRIKRDAKERGYNEDEVLYQWVHHVEPAYINFLLPYKKEAHYTIRNDEQPQGLDAIIEHLQTLK